MHENIGTRGIYAALLRQHYAETYSQQPTTDDDTKSHIYCGQRKSYNQIILYRYICYGKREILKYEILIGHISRLFELVPIT